jgi:alkylation response protein AidB-like acyl-CoA dehydrogenase
MDFDLSADQQALRDAAEDLLDTAGARTRARKLADRATQPGDADQPGYDTQLWKLVADQGWLTVALPEEVGGLGLGDVELAVLAERIGAHVAPVPVLSSVLALRAVAAAVAAGGPAAQTAEPWLQRLAAGTAIGCVGWADDPVIDAPDADLLVYLGADGVTGHPLSGQRPAAQPAMDGTRRIALADRGAAPSFALGPAELAEELLDAAAVGYAAEMLGAAAEMHSATVAYAKVREQFGQPIGGFQAVKHRLADALVDVEGMRSAVYYAAWAVSTGAADRSLAASTAKAWCSEASRRVLDSALQVHGGIGFTWEHDLHLYLKRAHLDQCVFGTARFHRRRIVSLLETRIHAGVPLW